MSANNYILIKRLKKGYEVSHRDAETASLFGKKYVVKSAHEALERAREIDIEETAEGSYIEYGIVYQPLL